MQEHCHEGCEDIPQSVSVCHHGGRQTEGAAYEWSKCALHIMNRKNRSPVEPYSWQPERSGAMGLNKWPLVQSCQDRQESRLLNTVGMENVKQMAWSHAQYWDRYTKCADVLLLLDNGTAILCHSKMLSLHSPVLRNMLEDLAGQHDEKIRIPLPCFSEAQCSALLKYLYTGGMSSEGAAFENHVGAAADVTRFAHTYDAPHALRQVEEYMVAFVKQRARQCFDEWTSAGAAALEEMKLFDGTTGKACAATVLEWASMADKYDIQELCGHCELAMVVYWERFQAEPDLVDQLSSCALQRIAKGLSWALATAHGSTSVNYPGKDDLIAWERFHFEPDLADQLSSCALQRIAKGLSRALATAYGSTRVIYPGKDDFIAWRQQQQEQQYKKKPRLH